MKYVSLILLGVALLFGLPRVQGRAEADYFVYLPLVQRPLTPPQFTALPFGSGVETTHPDIEPLADGRLYLVGKSGTIHLMETDGTLVPTPFLDISAKVTSNHNEQGLLAITLHPDFANNHYFYVAYTRTGDETTPWFMVVSRFTLLDGVADQADPDSEFIILEVPKQAQFHNGGSLRFGPLDGYFYITVGDDAHSANAQLGTVLPGKVLRIDVDTAVSISSKQAAPYAIPPDNPFVGDPAVLDEIFALGFRNPWRLRFDPTNGDMYIADVGESTWEEIDFLAGDDPGGQNFGWPCFEGNAVYQEDSCVPETTYTPPVYAYSHGNGRCSITGGHIYSGSLHPDWVGKYIFGDFCSGEVYSLWQNSPGKWYSDYLGTVPWFISTFGQDAAGEVYVGSFASQIIYKLIPVE